MIICGIDPGLKGAIAFRSDTGVEVYSMPVVSEDNYSLINVNYVAELFKKHKPDKIYIEKAQSMPRQGVVSSITIGVNFGILLGCIKVLGLPYELVYSKTWQKEFGIKGDTSITNFSERKKDLKKQSEIVVRNLFPDAPLYGNRGGLLDGRSDAILISEYGYRKQKK